MYDPDAGTFAQDAGTHLMEALSDVLRLQHRRRSCQSNALRRSRMGGATNKSAPNKQALVALGKGGAWKI